MSLANSSCLAIPSTQNTAPVHCFRCLYTYDLRRKAKRWQDGAVRFHTFNKRIMVYDVSRNFIGDTHWRDGGIIEDGDELQLDKGVLIQVGEKTESVDQDLTSLLERRGRSHMKSAENHDSSSVVPNLSLAGYPGLSSPSQLRPKSLNAILGTPNGPLGRAAQQMKSPCELRLQKEHDMDMQRGAKRRRIEYASKKGLSSVTTQDPTATSCMSNTKGDAVSGMAKAANGDGVLRQASPSTARVRRFQTVTLTAAPTAPQASTGCMREEYVGEETARPVSCPESTHLLNAKVVEKAPGHVMTDGVGVPKDFQEDDTPPMRKLQIMSRKPRKKLIYQDILPSVAHTDQGPQAAGKPNTDDASSRKRRKKADPQAEFHRAQRERIESRLEKRSRRENNASREENVLKSIAISDDEAHIPLPTMNRDISTEKHCGIPQSELSLPRGRSQVQPNKPPQRNRENPASPTTVSKYTTTTTTTTSPSDLDLVQMDQILLTRPSSKTISSPQVFHIQPPKPPHNPALASASSASAYSTSTSKPPPPKTPSGAGAAAAAAATDAPSLISNKPKSPNPNPIMTHNPLPNLPPPPSPKPKPHHKRSPMRKTVSEPLDRLNSPSELIPNRATTDQVPDPWSREAWDLFGCERPTKKKGEGGDGDG